MEININLTKSNRRLLKRLVCGLFPNVKNIKIKKGIATLKRGLFKKSISINVAELVLVEIPNELNNLGKGLELGEYYPYFSDKDDSIEYFQGVQDIIKELYSAFSTILLSDTLDKDLDEKIRQPKGFEVVESKKTKKIFVVGVENYRERVDEIINLSELPLKIVHIRKDSDVRGPPVHHTMILERVA